MGYGRENENVIVRTDYPELTSQLAEKTNNVVSVESFPKIVPEVDDSARIQRAISSLGTRGGTAILKNIVYTVNIKVTIPSNVSLIGAGPVATKIVAGNNNMTILDMGNGSVRASISNLAVDGGGKTGVTGINVAGTSSAESLHGKVEYVWIDSCQTGITGGYSYFIKFDTIRIMGTVNGFSLTSASNSITLINCALLCSSTGLTWNNSSGLAVIGCMFESSSHIDLYTCQGYSIEGCYFENTGGSTTSWITLGNGLGGSADGGSINGNLFNVGASYGIQIASASGVEIDGNYFHTATSAFAWYQSDNSPKRDIHIGNNTYNIGGLGYDPTKIIAYLGSTFDSLNCNANSEQVQPILFNQQIEPQPSTINNNQGVFYFDGTNLFLKKKNSSGTVIKQQLTGNYGAGTMPANQSSLVVNHGLGATPSSIQITPNSNLGSFWVDTAGNNSFTVHVATAPTSNGYFYWRAEV